MRVKPMLQAAAVQALSDWRIRSSGEGGLLLSFTNIVNEGMARQVAQQLRKALLKTPKPLRGQRRVFIIIFALRFAHA